MFLYSKTDALGRKSAMMIVNIPLLIAWFMMFNASTIWEIFVANILLGLGAGLMESPVVSINSMREQINEKFEWFKQFVVFKITYVAEICEPSIRGVMIAYTHVGWTLGMLFVSVMNTFMPWRTVGLVCMLVPILTAIALCFVSFFVHVDEKMLCDIFFTRIFRVKNLLCHFFFDEFEFFFELMKRFNILI